MEHSPLHISNYIVVLIFASILIDFRFEETNLDSGICKEDEECIGGFSRVYTAVRELLNERPNAIFLNAGDNYQGTLWYNLFRWNVTQLFLNMLPTDALVCINAVQSRILSYVINSRL